MLASYTVPEKIRIAWFSGTGGTKKAADTLDKSLRERGADVVMQELRSDALPDGVFSEDMLVIIYPVYAMNAPEPVYDYIRQHEQVHGTSAAVLSVSGGGELTPNKACRRRVVRLLEKRGYKVVYERMLIMPANVFTSTPSGTAVSLIRVLPEKIEKITCDILSGVTRRTKPGVLNTALAYVGGLERYGAKTFGRHIKASDGCNGCSLCAAKCPVGNIHLEDGRPVFGNKCVLCMKCLYSCPQRALSPQFVKFFVIKDGFSLSDMEKAAEETAEQTPLELPDGSGWAGVRKYLTEND